MRFQTENGVLIAQANGETLRIEPKWGKRFLTCPAQPCFRDFRKRLLTEVPEKTGQKQSSLRSIIWKSTDRWEKEPAHRSPMEKSVL